MKTTAAEQAAATGERHAEKRTIPSRLFTFPDGSSTNDRSDMAVYFISDIRYSAKRSLFAPDRTEAAAH